MPEAPHGAVAAPGPASNTVGLGFDGTAPPVQPFAGWARLLVVLAWVALLASILFMFTFPDWSDAQVRASDGMVLRDAQWSLDTENASEQWVTLPHRTPPFDTPTTSRYRLAFDLDQPLPSEQRLGLCVARWALSADVWLDGQRLATALQGFNALLEWNRPHYLALPPALAAGSHVLEFRVQPAPRGIDSMLSALWLGDDRMLRPGCEALTARHREQPATLRGALFAIGLLALMIGWRLRDPVSLWLAALAGVWTLQHLMLHMAAFLPIGELNLRMSPQSFLVGQMLLRFGFMLPLTVFCLRYLGLHLPRIERCIWAVAGAAALLLLVLPLSFHWAWWVGVGVFSVLLMLGVLLPLARHAWRHGSLSGDILLLSMLFLLASNLVDLLRPWIWMPEIPAGLSQVAVPTIIGTFGLLLAERLWLLYRRQQDAADSLGTEVARQHEQLQQNFALLRQQRDAEVEADERLRITRELHDGLGSHLVAAASLLASAHPAPGERAALAALVDQSLQELRNALDAIASETADVAELLGALRDRLEPVLAARGIELAWDVAPLPGTRHFGVAERLDVLRIVQEVFANILKHAGRCRVRLQAQPTPAGGSLITITDDGRGLAAAPKEGVGLPSMRERAQRLGAGLAIGPAERGGCRVTLSLPAPAQAPTSTPGVDRRKSTRNWLARAGK